MPTRTFLIFAFLIGALVAAGCAAPAAAPAAPAAAPAAGGPAQVTLTTNPDPAASSGETELVFEVKDSGGQPLTGATVKVSADMAAHSMGAMNGQATDQGNGRYATKVPFGMAGDWKITVEVSQGGNVLATKDFLVAVK